MENKIYLEDTLKLLLNNEKSNIGLISAQISKNGKDAECLRICRVYENKANYKNYINFLTRKYSQHDCNISFSTIIIEEGEDKIKKIKDYYPKEYEKLIK